MVRNSSKDGGYQAAAGLWLSDGWRWVCDNAIQAPLYWEERDGTWWQMTLRGMQPVDADSPVTHVSFFEADAFARWAERRLPTEAEWEHAARNLPATGNFVEGRTLRPLPDRQNTSGALRQMFGDVLGMDRQRLPALPGFRPSAGAVGEYNGKFMSSQMVLRGGSLRDAGIAYPGQLSQLLLSAPALAVHRRPAGGRCSDSAF